MDVHLISPLLIEAAKVASSFFKCVMKKQRCQETEERIEIGVSASIKVSLASERLIVYF